MSNAKIGKYKGVLNGRSKSVSQYDPKTKKLINTYQSIQEASLKYSSSSGISACCNGLMGQAYGYIWCFSEDKPNFNYKDKRRNKAKKVIQMDKDENIIKIYKSTIEAERFTNIDRGSDTLADQMPRICIQPVVENALTHGLRNVRRKDKKLLIRSEHVNENLVITVQDNGAGMDAESMNRLLDQNDMKRVESGISIGILNVNARLKRLFGEKYGLHIESTAGEGTTVTITVPAVSTENSGDMENV